MLRRRTRGGGSAKDFDCQALILIRETREAWVFLDIRCGREEEAGRHIVPVSEIRTKGMLEHFWRCEHQRHPPFQGHLT